MKIFALHGFLGQVSDFASLKNLNLTAIEYLKEKSLQPHIDLLQWGKNFNAYTSSQRINRNILLGYSQGARLAMQAYAADPKLWDALILISGNPGISESDKNSRLENDRKWAQRFRNEDFQRTVQEWNQQQVFFGSKNEPIRQEDNFIREQLAESLINWSVSKQNDFREILLDPHLAQKILIVVGEKDEKYVHLYSEIAKKNPRLTLVKIEDSGHRVILDQPIKLAEKISQFLMGR